MIVALIVLGVLFVAAICGYELRKPEVHGWLRRRGRAVGRLWHDLFHGPDEPYERR